MPVYLPLNGPGHKQPKAPSVRKWQHPSYHGVELQYGGWVGLRTDDLVVIDCDDYRVPGASERWRKIAPEPTYEVETPNGGRHFYYSVTPGSPDAPGTDIFGKESGIDIRAGAGAQVVIPPTPGYRPCNRRKPRPFNPAWMPAKLEHEDDGEGWDVIPQGRRDDTLAALAGGFRRQGMSVRRIFDLLVAINENMVDQGEDPITRDDLIRIATSAGRYEPQPDWEVELEDDLDSDELWQWMADMELPPPAAWHWHPYLPVGRLVLLDGAEGIGKGLFCARLATDVAERGSVLWLAAEDDPEEDIQRRLLAAGYDKAGHHPIGFATVDPHFPEHIDVLEQAIVDHDAQLVVMDPGRSYLAPPPEMRSEMSFNNEAALRPGLQELNRLAKRTDCTIVFVHHWNKNTQARVQYRQGGSGAFAQVVRHRITLAFHGPTDGGEGAFEVSKSNIGPKGHVHGYRILPNDAMATATFALSDPLDEYRDLDSWLEAMEKGEQDVEIDNTDSARDAIRALPGGAPVSSKALMDAHGIKRNQAADIIDELVNEGVLRRQGTRSFRIGEHER